MVTAYSSVASKAYNWGGGGFSTKYTRISGIGCFLTIFGLFSHISHVFCFP